MLSFRMSSSKGFACIVCILCIGASVQTSMCQTLIVAGNTLVTVPSSSSFASICNPIFSFDTPDANETGIDADGTFIWTGGGGGSGIYKVDGISGSVVQILPMPYNISGFWVGDLDFFNGYLYHVYEQSGMMHKIDPATGFVVDSLLLPNNSISISDPNNWGIACEDQFFWNAEYAVTNPQTYFSYIHKISYSGVVLDSFLIPHWILPIKLINGGLWGASFDTPWIYQFDKTNGAIIDSVYRCVNMCYGLTENSLGYWYNGDVASSIDKVHLFSSFTGMMEIPGSSQELKFFPNPTSGQTTLEIPGKNSHWISVELYNAEGICVRTFSVNHRTGKIPINLEGLRGGIHQVRLIGNESIQTGRLMLIY